MKRLFAALVAAATAAAGCVGIGPDADDSWREDSTVRPVTVEEALSRLDEFLEQCEGEMIPTRSGTGRKVASVQAVTLDGGQTRAAAVMSDAYIVNFADDAGFAVLGANTAARSIIAVTESGSLDAGSLAAPTASDGCGEGEMPLWDDETSDFYNYAQARDEWIGVLIASGIGEPATAAPVQWPEVSPQLRTTWSQGKWKVQGVYNKYCRTPLGHCTLAGCSTTALAMILAHNSARVTPPVDGCTLDGSLVTGSMFADELDPEAQEQVSLLYGTIFNGISKILFGSKGTGITTAAVERYIRNKCGGYRNVRRHCASRFSPEMQRAAAAMLADGLPIFISAFPPVTDIIDGSNGGHSWVIDGAKRADSGRYRGEYVVHCNWGWHGAYNGWFSTGCFNPKEADEYDGYHGSEFSQYSWHFRMLSYEI